jgi:3-carboxy-cis,cis-muconate cycloisomerase
VGRSSHNAPMTAITSTYDYREMARLSSSTSEPGLFDAAFGSAATCAATSDRSWVQAMLDVEAALAVAGARVGLLPAGAATQIATACHIEMYDVAAISRAVAADATPVVELVRQLRALVPPDVQQHVHLVATSQDIVDTATMLVARRALNAALGDARTVGDTLATLAVEHRDTVQVGRTLLQHGAVTTFGALCAGRLVALDDAVAGVARVLRDRCAVQLGGAVGTLAPAGDSAAALVAEVANELRLAVPVVPWHTSRGRVAELAAAAGILVGELAAVAQDIVLLSATEVGEVALAHPGSSSTMGHKRNPAAAVLAIACAHRVPGLVATVLAGMPQELQRATGRWQAEWGTLSDLLRLVGGTARHAAAAVDGLRVDPDRMRAHVDDLMAAGGDARTGSAGTFVDRAVHHHHELDLGGTS